MSDEKMTYTEEVTLLKNTMEAFKKELEAVSKDVGNVKEDVSQIKKALLGDEFNQTGLIKRIESNEKEIADLKEENQKLKDFKTKVIWWALGLGSGSGAGVAGIIQFFT